MSHSRREFLTGQSLRSAIEERSEAVADALLEPARRMEPVGGATLRLATRAMACDFAVVLNPGSGNDISAASDSLEAIHELEDQMSVFRASSEVSRLNRDAVWGPVSVESSLFGLLWDARTICIATEGAFDPTAGPLVALWRQCRNENRIPTDDEVRQALECVGIHQIDFDREKRTVQFQNDRVRIDLGGIGKGFALDQLGARLSDHVTDFLIHGGHSSLVAQGDHNGLGGWPVGLRNPLFPTRRLATILLKDQAFATSGSGVQFFRHHGQRFGHILDPHTGWPVDGMLSVSVFAPTAAQADALSTAFFVLGVAKTIEYCHNHTQIGAILIPPPLRNRRLAPVICGVPEEVLFFVTET